MAQSFQLHEQAGHCRCASRLAFDPAVDHWKH
jgi:hypothetical protein